MKYLMIVDMYLLWLGYSFTLSPDNYDKIRDNMSETQVQQILGSPTSLSIKADETTYVYQTDTSDVTLVFQNDMLKGKKASFCR